ncbi:MAG: hypothetical protein L3J50_06715 [Emcibacter sp.]|nr:hypothetical protein [Emcibacter sp.]
MDFPPVGDNMAAQGIGNNRENNMDDTITVARGKIEWALFLLRLGVFIVMFAWTLDKFLDPSHGVKVFEFFLFIKGLETSVMMALGAVEMIIILAFLAGLWKRYTYGFILIVHAISTFSSWKQYTIDVNLLFFAAWPMLAACIVLYMLRDLDVKFTIRGGQASELVA